MYDSLQEVSLMRKAFVACVRSVRKELLSGIHEGKEYISVCKQAGESLLSNSQFLFILQSLLQMAIYGLIHLISKGVILFLNYCLSLLSKQDTLPLVI